MLQQMVLLRSIRSRVAGVCLSDLYLKRYSYYMRGRTYSPAADDKSLINGTWHLPFHDGNNKLRDAENRFMDEGMAFGFNQDKLYVPPSI